MIADLILPRVKIGSLCTLSRRRKLPRPVCNLKPEGESREPRAVPGGAHATYITRLSSSHGSIRTAFAMRKNSRTSIFRSPDS